MKLIITLIINNYIDSILPSANARVSSLSTPFLTNGNSSTLTSVEGKEVNSNSNSNSQSKIEEFGPKTTIQTTNSNSNSNSRNEEGEIALAKAMSQSRSENTQYEGKIQFNNNNNFGIANTFTQSKLGQSQSNLATNSLSSSVIYDGKTYSFGESMTNTNENILGKNSGHSFTQGNSKTFSL